MKFQLYRYIILSFIAAIGLSSSLEAQKTTDERKIEVAMRMIGHQILLSQGDETSRVCPIEKDEERYKIQFEEELAIFPARLVSIIDSVMSLTQVASSYLVEIYEPEADAVVHSFQRGGYQMNSFIPCGGRAQPHAQYSLYFTLLDSGNERLLASADSSTSTQHSSFISGGAFLIVLLIGMALGIYLWTRKGQTKVDPDHIHIGSYMFDKRNMKLSYDNQKVDLTNKETDLLTLLYTYANTTLEREQILQKVWGDQGDYIGRTLDVFISKLRKKLEADPTIKITNIRGVGYKLVINE